MCYFSDILVDFLGICFNFIPKLVGIFEGGFATDGSEVGQLEEGVFVKLIFLVVVNDGVDQLSRYIVGSCI